MNWRTVWAAPVRNHSNSGERAFDPASTARMNSRRQTCYRQEGSRRRLRWGTGKRVVLSWVPDWSWGLPFLVLTVIAHVSAMLLTAKMLVAYRRMAANKASHFVIFVAFAALASAVFLAIDAAAWAGLYLWLGALPAWAPAMLFSLEAITSFGHAQIYLADRWQLLGAIEAVNGLILFGLTTAFLFAAIQQVWLLWRD